MTIKFKFKCHDNWISFSGRKSKDPQDIAVLVLLSEATSLAFEGGNSQKNLYHIKAFF